MGYLECQNCGGRYDLKEEESPGDFSDVCECGGKLNYFKNSKTSDNQKIRICNSCGFNNDLNADFCQDCGLQLNHQTVKCPYCNEKIDSMAVKCKHCGEWLNKKEDGNNQSKTGLKEVIRWKIVLPFAIATTIILIMTGMVFGLVPTLIICISGGIVGFIVKTPIKGGLNGLITGAICYFLAVMIFYKFLSDELYIYWSMILFSTVLGAIIGVIFGGLGGFLAKIVNK